MSNDARHMARAIQLAKKGVYTTTPNPNVGCVIVGNDGEVVGEGWHKKAGEAHAEVNALAQAGESATGATAYVTLEPCSHFGRTPPCALALIEAGVNRVVAAMQDPNPLVAGRGLKILSDAGIDVASGLMESEAKKLNRGFIKRMRTGKPWVTVKLASSLDGKTALQNGKSQWITGPEARQDVQRHRAQSCAILSGAGTVIADDPSLNVRFDELSHISSEALHHYQRQPLRALVDGKNQLHGSLKLLGLSGQVVVFNKSHNPELENTSAEQVLIKQGGSKVDLGAMLDDLGQRNCNNVWVEAGGKLAGALIEQKLVDELIVYQAPMLLGSGARDMLDITPLESLGDKFSVDWQDIRQVGRDIKYTGLLTGPEE